jgi:hypothetical protein
MYHVQNYAPVTGNVDPYGNHPSIYNSWSERKRVRAQYVPPGHSANINYGTDNKQRGNYDEGQGMPMMDQHNMTVQDIYRTPFLFIQEHRTNTVNMAETALKGIQCNSKMSSLFFSDENMKRIQRGIKRGVLRRTHGKYSIDVEQDHKELLIAMRAVYLEYGTFLPNQIVRQVKRLNQKVVDSVIPGIITNIKAYYGYLEEINGPLKPIARPVNESRAGRRTLPSISTTFAI